MAKLISHYTPDDHRVRAILHVLWTKAVGTKDYDKAQWKELEEAIEAVRK